MLRGIFSARAFVGWYNGLPEYRNLNPRLDDFGEEAVVIGQGNVALDVARMLVMGLEELRKTDITEYALEALSKSRVNRVRVVGRRGPLQAAFTVKELRELLSLQDVWFPPVDSSLLPNDPSSFPRAPKRIMQVLQKGPKTTLEKAKKSWELTFLRSPIAFLPSTTDPTRLGAIEFQKTQLEEPIFSATAKTVATDEKETITTGLAFRSIGYLSEPIPGFAELGIPFNHTRGLVPNEDGRVVFVPPTHSGESSHPVPGVYTSGWVKRGPTGVITTTMYDAFDTGDAIVNDWMGGVKFMEFGGAGDKKGWDAVKQEAKDMGLRPVNWSQWQKIDEAEKERGRAAGKEREKFASAEEMLSVLD